MTALRTVALRPLGAARCYATATPSRAPLWRAVAAAAQPRPTTLALAHHHPQKRQQSSSSDANPKNPPEPEKKDPPPPPIKLVFRALRQSLSFRPLLGAFRGQNLRSLFRQSPEELVLALALLGAASGVIAYIVYTYFNYFQSSQFTTFPPEIAKSLRKALYYSNYAPDPKLALKWYKIALEQCVTSGLDPFSDEVLGLRIQLAAWLEQIGNYDNSTAILETLLAECKHWVEVMEKSARDGFIDGKGHLAASAQDQALQKSGGGPGRDEKEEEAEPENLWAKRTRILGKSVGISVKLGELYADEHVLKSDQAGERLIWAVETVLKELQRRRVEGSKEGEGDWMSPEQIGGALEALGNHYESKSQHYLAAPLFLQAITLSPQNTCHTAVLMNNLAISLAQQPTSAATVGNGEGGNKEGSRPPTRASLLAGARQWALHAEAAARKVQGEERTEECDEACAVALCNLGDIAAMLGEADEARRRFADSLALSARIQFEPGVAQAQEGIRRLAQAA